MVSTPQIRETKELTVSWEFLGSDRVAKSVLFEKSNDLLGSALLEASRTDSKTVNFAMSVSDGESEIPAASNQCHDSEILPRSSHPQSDDLRVSLEPLETPDFNTSESFTPSGALAISEADMAKSSMLSGSMVFGSTPFGPSATGRESGRVLGSKGSLSPVLLGTIGGAAFLLSGIIAGTVFLLRKTGGEPSDDSTEDRTNGECEFSLEFPTGGYSLSLDDDDTEHNYVTEYADQMSGNEEMGAIFNQWKPAE
jgi:hypothetical protein